MEYNFISLTQWNVYFYVAVILTANACDITFVIRLICSDFANSPFNCTPFIVIYRENRNKSKEYLFLIEI